MNKKGFTLVELLAVVAILGILVIMAMPNVLGSFTEARTSTFKSNATKLVSAAQTDFITDRMKTENLAKTHFIYSSKVAGSELSLSSTGGLDYCIVLNASGEIIKFQATNTTNNVVASVTPVTTESLSLETINEGALTFSTCTAD